MVRGMCGLFLIFLFNIDKLSQFYLRALKETTENDTESSSFLFFSDSLKTMLNFVGLC